MAGIENPDALEERVDQALAIVGERDRAPHADVVERRLVGAHVDVAHLVGGELLRLDLRPPLLERVPDLDPVDAVDRPRGFPAEVVLARDEGGHARGIVLVHGRLDLVDVG